jgi:hypothetical protein
MSNTATEKPKDNYTRRFLIFGLPKFSSLNLFTRKAIK